MSEVMYGSTNPYYNMYPEYNTTQDPQHDPQISGYGGYGTYSHGTYSHGTYGHGTYGQDQGGGFNQQQSHNQQVTSDDWIPSGSYDSFNPDTCWPLGTGQQQSYGGVNGTSQVYTNQVMNTNGGVPNQIQNESYFPSFDEVPISDLIESVYKDVTLPSSTHSSHQSWNQSPNTDTGHRPSTNNSLYNNLVPPVDGYHHRGHHSYPQNSFHQDLTPSVTSSSSAQQLELNGNDNNNNLVPIVSNNQYLVSTPGYVLSQLESSTLPDVTTTQSQLSQSVSPIITPATSDPLELSSSSLVLEVNCFKCKLCDFLSLDKSNVLNHIESSHKQQSMVPNGTTNDQVVNQSSSGNGYNGSQRTQFLASNDLTTLLNQSSVSSKTVANASTKKSSGQVSSISKQPVSKVSSISKQPVLKGTVSKGTVSKGTVKLAPKVMPPILVLTTNQQTKSSSSSSIIVSNNNPSNQSSCIVPTTTIIIDNNTQNSLQSNKLSKSSERSQSYEQETNHSPNGALHSCGRVVEQGIKTSSDSSFLKSKDRNRKSKSVKKSKVKKAIGQELFHCGHTKCTAKFVSESNLERHVKCHIPGEELGFKCYQCEKFSSQHWSSTAGHLWREHAVDLELHKCEYCNYRSYSMSILQNQHKKIHSNEKNYVCDVCSKGFKNYKQLVNHRVRHSKPQLPDPVLAEQKKPECDVCGKCFKDRRALMVHMNSVHKKTRPYICNNCGHRASSRGALRTHVRSHTGEKPFKCDKCDYSTSDHNSLRRHKMRHSGERPYKCPFCTYACIQSSTYKQHLRNKHPGQVDGIMFTCSTCGFKTVNSENYSTHIREHGITFGGGRSGRSDGESSSSYSSSSSPATPALNGPESPDMHLVRGILGVSSVKDLHSLKRASSSSASSTSEDDSSLGETGDSTMIVVPVSSSMSMSTVPTTTSISLVNFGSNTNPIMNTQEGNGNQMTSDMTIESDTTTFMDCSNSISDFNHPRLD